MSKLMLNDRILGSAITNATNIEYDNDNTGMSANNIQDAVDELYNAVNSKATSTHNHDSRYYTEEEINSKIATINKSITTANTNITNLSTDTTVTVTGYQSCTAALYQKVTKKNGICNVSIDLAISDKFYNDRCYISGLPAPKYALGALPVLTCVYRNTGNGSCCVGFCTINTEGMLYVGIPGDNISEPFKGTNGICGIYDEVRINGSYACN